MEKEERPNLENFVILATFDDGQMRQIIVKEKNMQAINNIIAQMLMQIEGGVNVLDKPLEGLTYEKPKKEKTLSPEEVDAINNKHCIAVTCIPCEHPYMDKESPEGCANCGMLEWYGAFKTVEEANEAFKKQYPDEFDENGNYVKK